MLVWRLCNIATTQQWPKHFSVSRYLCISLRFLSITFKCEVVEVAERMSVLTLTFTQTIPDKRIGRQDKTYDATFLFVLLLLVLLACFLVTFIGIVIIWFGTQLVKSNAANKWWRKDRHRKAQKSSRTEMNAYWKIQFICDKMTTMNDTFILVSEITTHTLDGNSHSRLACKWCTTQQYTGHNIKSLIITPPATKRKKKSTATNPRTFFVIPASTHQPQWPTMICIMPLCKWRVYLTKYVGILMKHTKMQPTPIK